MATPPNRTLRALRDTDLTTGSAAEDIRSRKVIAADGEEIGTVDDLIVDDRERKVRFIRVASGGFLGIGKSTALIPVEAVQRVEHDVVHVDQTRERISGAPAYDPEIVDDQVYERIYSYYGYPPFWTAGYIYPPYPPML